MNKRLHILHLEDEPDFAELVRSLIEQDNLDAEVKQVKTREALEAAWMLNRSTSFFRIFICPPSPVWTGHREESRPPAVHSHLRHHRRAGGGSKV